MKRLDEQTHYEVLEVAPRATRDEIRTSYEKLRRLLGPGSLAVYSLVEPAEQQALVSRLDEAWAVLSDPAARRNYDASLGLAPPAAAPVRSSFHDALAAIRGEAPPAPERVDVAPPPPVAAPDPEIALDDDDLLEVVEIGGGETAGIRIARLPDDVPAAEALGAAEAQLAVIEESLAAEDAAAAPDAEVVSADEVGAEPEEEAGPEAGPDTVFTGTLLRQLRAARGISLDELSRRTRISPGHLVNLEEERWADLPERVFLRGFLTAYARELRLDAARVCETYLARRETKTRR